MFHVGQKVVCVDNGPDCFGHAKWLDNDAPIVGHVYTIRRCFLDDDNHPIVWLDEIKRGPIARNIWGEAIGYHSIRFRPVIERKTDISVFTAMLAPTSNRELVKTK